MFCNSDAIFRPRTVHCIMFAHWYIRYCAFYEEFICEFPHFLLRYHHIWQSLCKEKSRGSYFRSARIDQREFHRDSHYNGSVVRNLRSAWASTAQCWGNTIKEECVAFSCKKKERDHGDHGSDEGHRMTEDTEFYPCLHSQWFNEHAREVRMCAQMPGVFTKLNSAIYDIYFLVWLRGCQR